jgi:GT2 family glycosyltransferase
MENNISLLVGLKNNLDYNKHFYQTTRELYPEVEICFVSYGSTDGTHEWLDSLNDSNVQNYYSEDQKTFSDTFNKAAELATKEYVAYAHNDMVLAPGFLENIAKHIAPDHIVSYTTIEPPIFAGHERPGKIIRDFGIDLESFKLQGMYDFVTVNQKVSTGRTEPGITFFMCMPRKTLIEIGGMDNLYNPMFCEDDDLINRFKLQGFKTFTALDAICYHFVSKTSRFSEEYQSKTAQIELNSNRNYIRKWGSRSSTLKYDIGFVVKNCNHHLLEILEPWCSVLYVDCDYKDYISKEQPNTKFNLKERIRPYGNEKQNYILIDFDAISLTHNSFTLLQQLPDIIKESGEVGEFELDIFKITITNLETYEKELIKLDSPYYTNQLL